MKRVLLALLMIVLLVSVIGCTPSVKAGMPVVIFTDYGSDDYRVPRLKGIIYSTYPDVEIIDGANGLTAMDVASAGYVLDSAAREFPANVVFIAGVGSPASQTEQFIALLTNKGQYFVAPNNGLLTYVIDEMGAKEIHNITNTALFNKPEDMQSTQNILGRIAALLASGRAIGDVGPVINDQVMLDIQQSAITGGTAKGTIVFIDHFGTCLTNITSADVKQAGFAQGDTLQVTIGSTKVVVKMGTTYNSVATGEAVAFINSLGVLQVSLNSASFAAKYGLKNGMKLEVTKLP